MLRDARQTVRSNSIGKRWYFVALVTAAIAISYFDRQTLPVAISAIQKTIPLSDQQFSWLQFAFLIPYALLYAAGGRMLDVVCRHLLEQDNTSSTANNAYARLGQ